MTFMQLVSVDASSSLGDPAVFSVTTHNVPQDFPLIMPDITVEITKGLFEGPPSANPFALMEKYHWVRVFAHFVMLKDFLCWGVYDSEPRVEIGHELFGLTGGSIPLGLMQRDDSPVYPPRVPPFVAGLIDPPQTRCDIFMDQYVRSGTMPVTQSQSAIPVLNITSQESPVSQLVLHQPFRTARLQQRADDHLHIFLNVLFRMYFKGAGAVRFAPGFSLEFYRWQLSEVIVPPIL